MKINLAIFSFFLTAILVSCTRIQETNVDFGSKTFVNEYKTLTDALNDLRDAVMNQTTSLELKLAAIETAIQAQTVEAEAGYELIKTAIEALKASVDAGIISEQKALGQIKAAIESQTTSLELKLAAIEAAIQAQTIEIKAGDELIKTAIETLDASVKAGTLSEEKALGQLRAAVESQTSTLSTKLSAIEAANAIGFADIVTAEGLVRSAISSLSSSVRNGFITEEQALKQIEGAVNYQTGTLFVSLSAIDATNRQGFASLAWVESQIKAAIQELSYSVKVGTITENHALDQIKQAVNSQTFALSTNLMLIKSSIDFGLMNVTVAEQMVKDAVYALKASVDVGNVTEMYALDQIKQAVNGQTFTLSTNLMLIKSSIDFGLMNVAVAEQMVKDALVSFMGSNDQKLGQIITSLKELKDKSDENTTKITDILEKTAYDNGITIPDDFPKKIIMTKNAYESMKSESKILGDSTYCDTEKALIKNLAYNVEEPTTDQRTSDYPNGTGHGCFTASKTSEAPAEIIGQMTGDCYEVYKTREWVEYKFELSSGCSWPYLRKIEIEDAKGTKETFYENSSKGGTWTGIRVYHYNRENGNITNVCKKPRASAWCEG